MQNIRHNQKGLTLVEMLVTLGVIIVLSGIVLGNYAGSNQKARVDGAALNLASDIRVLQSNAMSLRSNAGNTPLGGWGLFISLNSSAEALNYTIFVDTDTAIPKYKVADNVKTVDLSEGVKIKKVHGNASNDFGNNRKLLLIFIPPDPDIQLCEASGAPPINNCIKTNDSIEITISNTDGTYEKKVIINKAGLVDVE